MNKVLIICSRFFPIRNGGTIRCEKLVKYLPDYNWRSIVLTKKPYESSKLDFSKNLKHCKIYRTKSFDIVSFLYSLKHKLKNSRLKILWANNKKAISKSNIETAPILKRTISEYFIVPDSDIFWSIGSMIRGFIISKKEKPDTILSSGPAHSSHLVALFLKKVTKINWVVEFRDPWTMNPFNIPKPFKILTLIDNYLEKIVLANADKINVTSTHYKDQFLKKYNFLTKEKIVCIPNGYDPEDFMNKLSVRNEKFTIVHSGNFYQHRSSDMFIKAVIYLFKNKLLDKNNFQIKFVGGIDEHGRNLIENSEFTECFLFCGQVSHSESINEICNADLLLLIPGPGEGTMPGKFYEYMATSKPIFCISNKSPAKDYIINYNMGKVVKDNNKEEIIKELKIFVEEIIEKKFICPDINFLKEKFNRKNIAFQMANLFNSF